jgi:hypothetical protein
VIIGIVSLLGAMGMAAAHPAPAQDANAVPDFQIQGADPQYYARFRPDSMGPLPAGRVVLQCNISPANVLTDCKVKSETPAGLGYGKASLRLAPHLVVLRPAGWKPTGPPEPVEVPVNWSAHGQQKG